MRSIKMKKLFKFIIVTAFIIAMNNTVLVRGNTQVQNDYVYMEKGQFSLDDVSLEHDIKSFNVNSYTKTSGSANTDLTLEQFLNSNPEIKEEIIANEKNGLILEDLAFTKVYLKEIVDNDGAIHFEPMTEAEYENAKKLRVTYKNCTLTIQYYQDSYNRGKATVNLQAVWPSGLGIDDGEATVTGSTDDYMAFVVAQNHDLVSHGMYGVARNVYRHALAEKGVAYRFRESTGSQTLSTNTKYYSYDRIRVFAGKYVHTWGSVNVSIGLGLGGPSVSITNGSKAWELPVELRKYSD